jgi:LmbE family N-acetylglucosaminyl deacetylase
MPHALFVYAHQDDEIATATRILHLVRAGWDVSCVYLTNGEGRAVRSHVRDEESRQVLARLGIDLERVHFLGSEARIPDGRLFEHLDEAFELLERAIGRIPDEIWTLAYEGGHQDHDAAHLVAVAYAVKHGVPCFEMPLYHGYGLPGPFFNALAPLRNGGGWTARKIALGEGFRIALLCRYYASQRKTWLGLLPEALLRLALGRKEWTRPAQLDRVRDKPHRGKLFYERRFGVSWEEFASKARPFVSAIAAPPRRESAAHR